MIFVNSEYSKIQSMFTTRGNDCEWFNFTFLCTVVGHETGNFAFQWVFFYIESIFFKNHYLKPMDWIIARNAALSNYIWVFCNFHRTSHETDNFSLISSMIIAAEGNVKRANEFQMGQRILNICYMSLHFAYSQNSAERRR